MRKTIILTVLDGYGIGKFDNSNPIYAAKPKYLTYLKNHFPYGALKSSGLAVGLPWEEPGNSEVGHLTLGAWRVLYQHYQEITMAIEDKTFFGNQELKKVFLRAKETKGSVHLVGLLSSGTINANLKHLFALIEMAKQEGCENLFLHLITDGKEGPQKGSLAVLQELRKKMEMEGVGTIASVMGRYYAMDRSESWDRTEKAYLCLTGNAEKTENAEKIIQETWNKNLTDEFIPPTITGEPHPIKENDSVIFFNFREDNIRELVSAFLEKDFKKFARTPIQNLQITTFTKCLASQKEGVVFPNESVENVLGKVLSDNEKIQLRVAETEKQAHITYFFNGLQETPYKGEVRVIIPSVQSARPTEHPEMRASVITDRALASINEGGFDFILINYANPDMMAHTGDFDATQKAIETIDAEIGRLAGSVLEQNHILIITSDHGNSEEVLDQKTGEKTTTHNANPVPLFLVGKEFQKQKNEAETYAQIPVIGLLSDVAPTILELFGIEKPKEMTGESLLSQLT